MSIGKLIVSCGYTISEIAGKMGVDETQVMAWVCGEVPDAQTAANLAEVLGASAEQLYAAILETPNLIG